MQGYYRFPTIFKNRIAFVSEDDLWQVDINNKTAYRVTSNLSPIHAPYFSPDGKFIAYVGTEDGNTEIYLIPSQGGVAKRLTYEGAFISKIASWDKNNIIYATDLNQPFGRISELRKINIKDGQSKSMKFGVSSNIAISKSFTVLGRNTQDPARWKRYKGGTAGELWVDIKNDFNFKELIKLKGNLACPMILSNKVYFISDHSGIGLLNS